MARLPRIDRETRRFRRQFDALGRQFPAMRGTLERLQGRGWILVRLPLAILLILGGLLSFLPVLGFWMLPLGLLLLAVDLPVLRPPLSRAMINGRRRYAVWRHRRARKARRR